MKLEYGKRYVLRCGAVTEPLKRSITDHFRLFSATCHGGTLITSSIDVSWDDGGRWRDYDSDDPWDIVSEYCESVCEKPAPEPRKLQWVPGRTYKMRNGGLVFVILVDEGQSYPVTGFRIYPGEDAEQFPNTWTIHGRRHMGHVESSFDIVDYAYEVGETDDNT